MTNRSTKKVMKEKKQGKKDLADILSLNKKSPILGIFLDKEIDEKFNSVFLNLLEGLDSLNVEVVILADSSDLGANVKHLPYNRKNRKILLEAADLALSFDFNDVEEMLIHGTIPVSPYREELTNYNPNKETGNAFVYLKNDQWTIFAAIVRALETFRFPYDWKHIVKEGLDAVCEATD